MRDFRETLERLLGDFLETFGRLLRDRGRDRDRRVTWTAFAILAMFTNGDRANFQFAVEIAEILFVAGEHSSFMTWTTLVPLLLKRRKR